MVRFFTVMLGVAAVAASIVLAADKISYVDLQPKSNQKMTDTFHSGNFPGNNLAELPKGEQTFEGVKFKIDEGLIQLGSKMLPDKPKKIEGIKVDKTFKKLYMFHATGFGNGDAGDPNHVDDDTQIGEYTIHYEDKSKEVIPIVYGKDVRDWWFPEGAPGVSRGKVGWIGDNEATKQVQGMKIRLYIATWENPKPEKKVVCIDYSTTGETVAAPFCVAITCEG